MYNFSLSKRVGLTIAVIVFLLSLALYGADYQIYGYDNLYIPGFAAVTLALAVIHYSRPADTRHSHDAETIGWAVLAMLVAGLYLARDMYALNEPLVQNILTGVFTVQLLNYAACKYYARKKG